VTSRWQVLDRTGQAVPTEIRSAPGGKLFSHHGTQDGEQFGFGDHPLPGAAFAGEQSIAGQNTLKLAAASTSVLRSDTLWVNASTYLPVQETSVDIAGHVTNSTYTWLPNTTANTAVFNVTVPSGYQQLASPSTGLQNGVPGVG